MFVGESGVARVIQRACEIMTEHKTDDVRKYGGIDLPTLQKYLNFHFSVSVDLFGQELSTNAANYYAMGLKGRFEETKIGDDHVLDHARYPVAVIDGNEVRMSEAPALTAINERLRDDYVKDCQKGVDRWNKVIAKYGVDFELKLPHRAFHRAIGTFSEIKTTPEGKVISEAEWTHRHGEWLPGEQDRAYVGSLMVPVTQPGKVANWIAAPAKGIDGKPVDFEYIRFV